MKREFLQEFKVEGNPLPKQVIDAIMAENGRDIQKAKAVFADHDALKSQLEAAQQQLQEQQAQQQWKTLYEQAVAEHTGQVKELTFRAALEKEVLMAKGRSHKAIAALLDTDALKESEDPAGAIRQALQQLQQEHSYLFEAASGPAFARDTGAYCAADNHIPGTLAGALREKFERK